MQASQLQASGGTVRTAVVNVCDNAAHDAAIKQHVAAYNSLDLVVLNAGIGERTDFLTSPDRSWEVTLDVDLRAVLVGVQSAARAMMQTGKPGSIVSVASAAGKPPLLPFALPLPARTSSACGQRPPQGQLRPTGSAAAPFACYQLVHAHRCAGQAAHHKPPPTSSRCSQLCKPAAPSPAHDPGA